MDIRYKIAEDLIDQALIRINNEDFELAYEIFLKALNLYNHFIIEETDREISSYLYFKRGIIFNHLGKGLNIFPFDANYYLDIKRSMIFGNNEAKIIYESNDFKKKNENEKITFIFEVSETNNYLELSSLYIKGYYHDIEKVTIRCTNNIVDDKIKDFLEIYCKDSNYTKLLLRLIHGSSSCDNFICYDLIKTKNILKKYINGIDNLIEDLFNDTKAISLKNEILKNTKIHLDNPNIFDSFNLLFNKKVNGIINSELSVLMSSDCYRLLHYLNKYSSQKNKVPRFAKIFN